MSEGSAKHLVRVWVWDGSVADDNVSGYTGFLDGFCQHTKIVKFFFARAEGVRDGYCNCSVGAHKHKIARERVR